MTLEKKRNWNLHLDSNSERELYLQTQYDNIILHLTPDPEAGICITGGNSFAENEIHKRLVHLEYKDVYVYEMNPTILSWYKTTNYIKNSMKKYSKYIFLREIDILSDYQHNISFISNDIQGDSVKTQGLNTYSMFDITGALQVIHAFIGKNKKEVGWLLNTSVRPQGVNHYLNLFQSMKSILAEYRIHCIYETQGSRCYNHNMFTFGGVFKVDKRLTNQTLRNIGIKLLAKGYL